MSTEITVPTLGESVTTATVARWIKHPGESVAADEPLVELETDKVTVEVNAPSSGTLTEIAAAVGATVEVGALLGVIGAAGAATKAVPTVAPAPVAAAPAPAAAPAVMPSAKKIAADGGIDTNAIAGTAEDYALDVFESQIMTDGAKLVGFGHGQSALCFASRIPADYSKVWGDLPPTGVIDLVTDPLSGITMMMARYVLHDSWAADARTALMFGTAPGQTKAGVRVVTK